MDFEVGSKVKCIGPRDHMESLEPKHGGFLHYNGDYIVKEIDRPRMYLKVEGIGYSWLRVEWFIHADPIEILLETVDA